MYWSKAREWELVDCCAICFSDATDALLDPSEAVGRSSFRRIICLDSRFKGRTSDAMPQYSPLAAFADVLVVTTW
jgi:hypothetical protein